jgi:hypothetical protein
VWLDGVQVWRSTAWTGWHAGKERIPVDLAAGPHRLVVEAEGAFFCALTPERDG